MKQPLLPRMFRCILILLVLGGLYYLCVYRPMHIRITALEADTATMETNIAAQRQIAARKAEILPALDTLRRQAGAPLAPQNSQSRIIALFGDCLAELPGYTLNFSSPERSGGVVLRRAKLDFLAPGYEAVEEVLTNLCRYEYLCYLGDLSLTPSRQGGLAEGPVSVALEIVFCEEAG